MEFLGFPILRASEVFGFGRIFWRFCGFGWFAVSNIPQCPPLCDLLLNSNLVPRVPSLLRVSTRGAGGHVSLLGFSRFHRYDWGEGLESYSLSTLSSPTEPSRGWDLLNSLCGSAKSHSEGIVTFDIGVQCFQCSAKRLAPHLAEFFPSTVERSLEFVAFKKFWQRTWNWKPQQ